MKLWVDSKAQSSSLSKASEHSEEEEDSTTFEVILCDNCDGEFYSDEAFTVILWEFWLYLELNWIFPQQQHDKGCGKSEKETIVLSDDDDDPVEKVVDGKQDFLAYFSLASTETDFSGTSNTKPQKTVRASGFVRSSFITKKEKDLENSIPFSSPAGIILTRNSTVTSNYINDCLKEVEAFTPAKPTTKLPLKPRNRLFAQDDVFTF